MEQFQCLFHRMVGKVKMSCSVERNGLSLELRGTLQVPESVRVGVYYNEIRPLYSTELVGHLQSLNLCKKLG